MPTSIKGLKERILKERGLKITKQAHQQHKIKPSQQFHIDARLKTPYMKYLELKYREPIESILMSGSLSQVAKRLGNEVDVTTISKWIKRLKLKYTLTNLPDCAKCKEFGIACQAGICTILCELELWDLVEIKKQELKGGK